VSELSNREKGGAAEEETGAEVDRNRDGRGDR